MGWEKTVL